MTPERVSALFQRPPLSSLTPLTPPKCGAVGAVVKARARDGKCYALKLMTLETERERLRFQNEVTALQNLSHPSISHLKTSGPLSETEAFIAMEWIEGESLKERVERSFRQFGRPPAEDWIRARFLELVDALRQIHAAGLIHRDIKPANLMIASPQLSDDNNDDGDDDDASERLVIVDFGIARDLSHSDAQRLTQTGESIGSPAFMSPEQIEVRGEFGETSAATDIWGLGATLYFTLLGRAPFEGQNIHEVLRAIISNQIITIPSGDFSPRLLLLIQSCLQREASARPDIDSIERILNEADDPPSPPVRSLRWLAYTAILGLLIAILGAVALEPPPLSWLEVPEPAPWTNLPQITLSGQLNRAAAQLLVGEQRYLSDEQGRFKINLLLREGPNEIGLELLDAPAASRRWTIVLDSRPPELSVLNPKSPDNGAFRLDPGSNTLRLLSTESNIAALSINGREQSISADNSWSLPISEPGLLEMTLSDRAGNIARTEVSVEPWDDYENRIKAARAAAEAATEAAAALESERQRKAILELAAQARPCQDLDAEAWLLTVDPSQREETRRKARAELEDLNPLLVPLADLEDWSALSKEQQLACATAAASVLGDKFQLLSLSNSDLNSDKSKPETKNILLPLFKHKITGLSFLLIPGGWQRLRFWFRHRSVELVTSLRKFAFDYFQKEIFSEFFLRYYEEFCPQLYQALKLEVKLPQALAAALAALTPDSPEVDRLALDRQRRQAEVEQLARYLFEEQVERLPRVRDALCQRYLQWARQIGWRDTDLYTPPFLIAAAPVHRAAWLAAGGQLAPGTPVDSNPISNLDYESARRWLAALPELRLPNRREWTRAATCDSSGRSIFGLQSLFGPSAEWAELDLSGREELIQRGGAQAQEAYRARPEWNPLMGGCDPTSRALRDPTIFRMAAATELPGLSGLRPAASFIKDTKNTDKH